MDLNFKVKKGKKFFSGPRWNFFGIRKSQFDVIVYFHDDCIYELNSGYDQINKIVGHSLRLFPWYDKKEMKVKSGHHKESVRFGWRSVGNKIEILAYAYVNGVRVHKKMISVKTEMWTHLNFKETKDLYEFTAVSDDRDFSVVRIDKKRKGFFGLFIYRLYPYFGGRFSAPNDMRIDLKYLKRFIL